MQLTPIEKSDFPDWQRLRKAVYGKLDSEYDRREMELVLKSASWHCFFIRSDDARLLGLVELSSRNIVDGCLTSPVAYLEALYLLPENQGRGMGRQVIQQIFDWCRVRGFSELATDTELENIRAQGFYRSLGFEETDRVVEFRIDLECH